MGSFCPKTTLLNFPPDSFHLDKAYENHTVKMYCIYLYKSLSPTKSGVNEAFALDTAENV